MSDLVIMLTGVIFLFNLTAFSGKDEEDHLHRAQRSLAAMQSLVHPPQATSGVANGGTSNSVDAASGAPCGEGMDGGAAAADACGAPTAAATFVRFCTATYAVCMGCMEDAVAILRQALRDAPMLEALAEANAPNGAGPGLALWCTFASDTGCHVLKVLANVPRSTAHYSLNGTPSNSGGASTFKHRIRVVWHFSWHCFLLAGCVGVHTFPRASAPNQHAS